MLTIYRMFLSVDYYPAVIRPAMRRAVHVMNTRGEPSLRREECLPIRKDRRVRGRCYFAIEILVDDDFNKPHIAVGHGNAQRQNVMAAMRASAMLVGGASGDSAHHDVVDAVALAGA